MSDSRNPVYTIKAYGYNVNGDFLKTEFSSDHCVNIGFDGEANGFSKHLRHHYPVSVNCYNSHGEELEVSFEPEGDTYVYIDEFDELIISDKPPPRSMGNIGFGSTEIRNTVLSHVTKTSEDNYINYEHLGWDDHDDLVAGNKELIRQLSEDYLESVRRIIVNLNDMRIADSDGDTRSPAGLVFDSDEVLVLL